MNDRAQIWIVAVALGFLLGGCGRKADSLERTLQTARPELRKAIDVLCTPTRLGDNYDEELQVAYRLHLAENKLNFTPTPSDRAALKALATNSAASTYSRICAAYFLVDNDWEARSLLTNYVASGNLRHRFNAARAIQWFAAEAQGEPREWAALELVKMIEGESLELPLGTYTPTEGYEKNGCDLMDDVCTPLRKVISTLGELKERRAIPGLTSIIERHQVNSFDAIYALGEIGDPAVGPFLLRMYPGKNSTSLGAALGMLRYRPAVPALVDGLNQSTNTYEGTRILENLLEIGDATAIPEMEKYVKSLTPEDQRAQKAGARILVQMRENDPVAVLLKMFDDERDEDAKVDLLQDLGRYRDPRAIDKLFAVAVSSDSTLFRGNAIRTLSRIQDRAALLALVSIMETKAPPPKQFDKLAILDGRPPDYSKREAARALREATHQNLGEASEAWRRWILENR